ncbi:MAG: DUF559 domain-containing protein [Acidobacteria bacterium]|nr:DUF559 domain-containing protein [Acidobacteriota bacterium]
MSSEKEQALRRINKENCKQNKNETVSDKEGASIKNETVSDKEGAFIERGNATSDQTPSNIQSAAPATPPKKQSKSAPPNSPPWKGGVAAGRGGLNNLPYLKNYRRKLRRNLTPAEARFWKLVQGKSLDGRKFRRQHSVGPYILDFYCPSEKLAVELDGAVHFNDAARERDARRRLFLSRCGIEVLRFENRLVFEDPERVLGIVKSRFGRGE